MSDHFIDFATASDYNYCRAYCAKCRLKFIWDFIEPMERSRGALPKEYSRKMFWDQVMKFPGVKEHLAEELESLPLLDLLKLKNWDGLICIAFDLLNDGELQARILREWIKTCPDEVRFFDVVIFHLLPRVFCAKDIYDQWISKAVRIAEAKRDYSLVESLVWRLKTGINQYPALLTLATEMQENSPAIAKAMKARFL